MAASPAKRLKKSSSGPNTMEGRTTAADAMAARTAASPSALVRAYSDGEFASAPMAETCTKRVIPSPAACSATDLAAAACRAAKPWRPASNSTPTRLTAASDPSSARATLSGKRMLACISSIWPTSPMTRSSGAMLVRRMATRMRQPSLASARTT